MPLYISTTKYITTSIQVQRDIWFEFRRQCVARGWKTKYALTQAMMDMLKKMELGEEGRKPKKKRRPKESSK